MYISNIKNNEELQPKGIAQNIYRNFHHHFAANNARSKDHGAKQTCYMKKGNINSHITSKGKKHLNFLNN